MRLYAENNTNYIRSLDTGSEIKLQVINNDNSPVNLTTLKSTTVIIGQDNIGRLAGITPHYIDEFGFLKFKFNKNNSLNAGRYYLEVHMQTTEDHLMISPTRNKFIMEVEYSIDELGNQVAVMAVQELLDNIQAVKDTVKATEEYAKETLEKANEALSGVESANQNATEALSKATNAENQSTTALSNSTNALTKANTAESNSSTALSKATTAETSSSNANTKSDEALTKANKAITDSGIALGKATTAETTSNTAIDTANRAMDVANNSSEEALATASEAITKATNADTKAETAITTANTAKTTADAVRAELDELVLESGNTDAEVIQSRTNADNVTFTKLKERLDDSDTKLKNKAEKTLASSQTDGLMRKEDKAKFDDLVANGGSTTIAKVTGLQEALNKLTAEDAKVVFGNELHGLRINSAGNLEYLNTTNSTWVEIKSGSGGGVTEEQIREWNSKETVTGSQAKADNAERLAKAYADEILSSGGTMKHYDYKIVPTFNGQTDFKIPLLSFNKTTDFIIVTQNRTVLEKNEYSIVKVDGEPLIRLVEGVEDYTESSISIYILKNVPKGEDTDPGTGRGLSEEEVQAIVDVHAKKADIHTTLAEKASLTKVVTDVGDKTLLLTENKADIVGAVNEVLTKSGGITEPQVQAIVNNHANDKLLHKQGTNVVQTGTSANAIGVGTTANVQASLAIGNHNKPMTGSTDKDNFGDDVFVIGNGVSAAPSNAFRIRKNGVVYGNGAYNSTGADYAEYFEWKDGNTKNEDRVGYFVSISDGNICQATTKDKYILGITSVNPSIVGDSYQDDWADKYLTDEWGRIQYEWIDVAEELNEDGDIIQKARKDYVPILNPNWNNEEEYIPREKRPEWSPVGIMGKLLVHDDGTCKINGYCKPNDDGIATASEDGYIVLERVSENIVKVFLK